MSVTTKNVLPAILYLLLFLRPLCIVCNELGLPEIAFVLLVLLPSAFLFRKHLNSVSIIALTAVLVLHAQWGIFQFILQQDFNLYLLGESPLSSDLPGVAKFSIGSDKLLRGYGPYSHANVFGGAMLVGLILVNTVPLRRITYFLHLVLLLALVLSFSRTAYAGYFIYLVSTLRFEWFHFRKALLFALVLVAFAPLVWFRATDPSSQALMERSRGYEWSMGIITQQAWKEGVGFGNYETTVEQYLEHNTIPHEIWEIAPVHSAPLFLIAEIGFVPAAFLICVFSFGIATVSMPALLALVPPLLLDHYFLTELPSLFLLVVLYTAWHGGGISSKYRTGTPSVSG